MTPDLEQQYDNIIKNAPGSFRQGQNYSKDAAYIKNCVDQILNEPDSQKAAQMAYNMCADMPHSTVGQIACKALFDRAAVHGGDPAQLAAGVGNEILKAQLRGEMPGQFSVGSFARGSEAINGFNAQYFSQTSPGYDTNIKQQVADIANKHGINGPNDNFDPAASSAIAQDFLDLSCQDHYSDASKAYLAGQKQIILTDTSYDARLVAATQTKLTPNDRAGDPTYVKPDVSDEQLQSEKQQLADNFTSNNSALRLVGPAIATHAIANPTIANPDNKNNARDDINWRTASQASLQILNRYDQDDLTISNENTLSVAQPLFTDANKQQVATMHQRIDGAQPNTASLDLIDTSKNGQQERQDTRQAARQAAPAVEQQANPDANALNEGVEKKSKLTSVRDALRGAVGKIQDAAHDLGAGIKDKIEQVKLNRLEKQVEKRQDHINNVQGQKTFVDEVKQMSPKDRQQLMADLQAKVDPELLLKGNRQERAAQMQLMDQIEVCKMSPEKLDQHADKLQERLDKNEEKLGRLEQKRDAQKAKVDLRAARHANAQQQPQQAHGHGH